jgi:inhibitor of KinA sporulation pathway (predicted exonuclease)
MQEEKNRLGNMKEEKNVDLDSTLITRVEQKILQMFKSYIQDCKELKIFDKYINNWTKKEKENKINEIDLYNFIYKDFLKFIDFNGQNNKLKENVNQNKKSVTKGNSREEWITKRFNNRTGNSKGHIDQNPRGDH